ncbi:similar to Saccharomyces cerevisiae YDL145C COP1 Alpha subunit of COPI vesicle coatomer complex (partial ?) [Maudiozyma saulgeensis]|uniref:Similar to Saccharomyces cerevisiae YDL145C COP1 Alpha subunit of COPI vesicle coatomer complex (Partial ?) n=1 Tax=Maudiozyma saulgeensis TaxID=1789683 RepID=A0A1X7QYL4_9SACH|nr:similar to Saccharomyces cerevisiae YDL145C COP1 Alpha subunit of COPI vesicle coatomer complex (partial ?) [Kazachstania saulgeensis]
MKIYTKFHLHKEGALTTSIHPQRPCILITLKNGVIELWDYRMGVLLQTFNDHNGPVRGIDFHPTKELFASSGDDSTIKVWSLNESKPLYTLKGHLDTVRTVFFHQTEPWLISASDDQSIRIWNWQNRQEIACLLGHTDYVMCANFHPHEFLVVSASLDKTACVWDISKLQKQQFNPLFKDDQEHFTLHIKTIMKENIFSDFPPKFVMIEHTKGVNWASFHPQRNLIVTCGEDNEILTWEYTATKIKLKDKYLGHTGPVTAVVFHPMENYIISTSKDRSFLVFSLTTHNVIKKYGKNNRRFLHLSTLSNRNILSSTNDSGIVIFKINKDRQNFSIDHGKILLINPSKQVQLWTSQYGMSIPYTSLKSLGEEGSLFRCVSYNASHHTVLVSNGSNSYFKIKLYHTVRGVTGPNISSSGTGTIAKFFSNNDYFIYNAIESKINHYSMEDKLLTSVKLSQKDIINDIFTFNQDLFLLYDSKVCLYDLESKQIKNKVDFEIPKEIISSKDQRYVAIRNQYSISILDINFKLISSVAVNNKIKSFAWNDDNILIFSTATNLMYMLLNEEAGIIKTLRETIYIIQVVNNVIFYIDKTSFVKQLEVDLTECYYKKALYNKDMSYIMETIKTSKLVGRKIVEDTSEAGFHSIAIGFTNDKHAKFCLALKSNNLKLAYDMAAELDKKELWSKLVSLAIIQGDMELAEICLKSKGDFDRLSFLYLVCGSKPKLNELEKTAYHQNDLSRLFQYSIYGNSLTTRINSLNKLGCYSLAYLVARSNGDNDAMRHSLHLANIKGDTIIWPDNRDVTESLIKKPLQENFTKWPLHPSTE